MYMPAITLIYALLLIGLGLIGYFGTSTGSVTALIPTFLGIILLILGLLGRRESARRHAMHFAAALGLVGLLGSARGLPQAIRLIGGDTVARPEAAVAQAVMAALSLIYLIFCVMSFIGARRGRKATADPART
jgi:hypothetical protein